MIRVYVAGSSAEIERVERWSAALVAAGIEVVSSWPQNVRAVGSANPRDASREQRLAWTATCLVEVTTATVVWFLVPGSAAATRGAWAEIGFARGCSHDPARRPRLVFSGDTKQSIFCALGDEHDTDEAAFAAITGTR